MQLKTKYTFLCYFIFIKILPALHGPKLLPSILRSAHIWSTKLNAPVKWRIYATFLVKIMAVDRLNYAELNEKSEPPENDLCINRFIY